MLRASGETDEAARRRRPRRATLASRLRRGTAPRGARRRCGPGADVGALTPREREILALVATGRSNGEIGKQLFISGKTVSVHVSNVMAKLGAASRTEAAALARRAGLLD